jgi:Flp pilus assembly protein TadG
VTIRRRIGGERGSVAISGLLFALALIVLVGTGVDIAQAFIVRRDLTAIADNAALVGSQQLDLQAWRQGSLSLNTSEAEQSAAAELAAEPQITASTQAVPDSITVRVRRRLPTMMLRLVGISVLTVSATATAQPKQP